MAVNFNKNPGLIVLCVAVAAIVVMIGYHLMNRPDTRSPGEKIGDAISEMGDGLDDAGRQLQSRTPAEKLGDAVEEAGDDAHDAISR